jgi:predicted Zn-dependent peptidase
MNKIEILGAKETLYVERLDNGLDIYMIPNNKVKTFYLTLNVNYGSIYTEYKFNGDNYTDPKGIAHYLEHIMFRMPDDDAFEYFTKLGSNANAFTANNITCYEVLANSKFKENLSYLLKFVYTPYFTKDIINKERGIISEEIKMYEDDPSTSLVHDFFQNIFINDERKYLITGSVEDIKEIKLEDIENVYNAFYHPKNMFLILTGNFNPEEAVAITTDVMKDFSFPDYKVPEIKFPSEPFKINTEYTEKFANVSKNKVVVGYKIPKSNFKSLKLSDIELRLYLNLIIRINFGITSLINEEMKSNGIINRSLYPRLSKTEEYYIPMFIGETDYPDYFIKRIKETFDSISVTEEDISRKIKSAISDLVWTFDNIENVNYELQDDILNYDNVITDIYQIYKSLNYETTLKVIDKLKKNLCSVHVLKTKNNETAN